MIGYIKGKLLSREEGLIVIENGGIGYEVHVPDPGQFVSLQEGPAEAEVWTTMVVREDDISLYGFRQKADLMLFKKLLNVNGVGAKAALAILSVMRADALSRAILFEDIASITRAPGIGKKTAQRIVLELKDKLADLPGLEQAEVSLAEAGSADDGSDPRGEALQALVALGYSRSDAAAALSKVKEEFEDPQGYIKKALAKLMR
ncbi:MAG: Holliday junction branch migration protein RuvA [Firmicutes bacterium]|nr:Holliday junction branch migration protein RuvA [Bacillota bacterium]